MLADELRDEDFAHRHAPLRREAPVEDSSDCTAAGLGDEGFQANDLLPHPFRLRGEANEGNDRTGSAAVARRARTQPRDANKEDGDCIEPHKRGEQHEERSLLLLMQECQDRPSCAGWRLVILFHPRCLYAELNDIRIRSFHQ